jgi:hypothetical protein
MFLKQIRSSLKNGRALGGRGSVPCRLRLRRRIQCRVDVLRRR